MKKIEKRDGFCRAPRIEMINENNKSLSMSFDEMMNSVQYEFQENSEKGMIGVVARNANSPLGKKDKDR